MRLPIAVCTALAWESAAVRTSLHHVRKEQERVWHGFARDREVFVITGGIGAERARQTLAPFLRTPLAALLSLGCAGALHSGLAAGHLILGAEVSMYARKNPEGFMRFSSDRSLLAQGRTAALKAAIPFSEGSLFTSATVLCSPAEKYEHGRRTGALGVEMESATHAMLAAARNLPFLALRVILDHVEMSVPEIGDFVSPAGDTRTWRAATAAMTHPSLVPQFLALRRAQTVAVRTLARLCAALLPKIEPSCAA